MKSKSLSKKLLSGIVTFAVLAVATILFTNFMPANDIEIDIIEVMDTGEVLGKWNVVSFVSEVADFNPVDVANRRADHYWWQSVEFLNDGIAIANIGNRRNNILTWTEGEMELGGWWSQNAPSYKIKTIDSTEYLFIEWTQPDYVVQGTAVMYFVFERAYS